MKKIYLSPNIDNIYINLDNNILINHSEPEITSNIGANENNIFEEDEEENMKINLWNE